MAWRYYITDANSTHYSTYSDNTTTTANDYFSDWIRSFTTAGTGTTYNPYSQPYPYTGTYNPYSHTIPCIGTYMVPLQTPFTIRQEIYHDQDRQGQYVQEQQHQEPAQQQQEPVQQQLPQESPEQIKEETDAAERAKNLLLEYLDEDNKQKFLDKKHLEIASKLFKNVRYHIPLSKLGRIKAWKDDKIITELCIVVKEVEKLPTEDVVLAKLLHVMNDEVNMLRTANHSNVKENLLAGLN